MLIHAKGTVTVRLISMFYQYIITNQDVNKLMQSCYIVFYLVYLIFFTLKFFFKTV